MLQGSCIFRAPRAEAAACASVQGYTLATNSSTALGQANPPQPGSVSSFSGAGDHQDRNNPHILEPETQPSFSALSIRLLEPEAADHLLRRAYRTKFAGTSHEADSSHSSGWRGRSGLAMILPAAQNPTTVSMPENDKPENNSALNQAGAGPSGASAPLLTHALQVAVWATQFAEASNRRRPDITLLRVLLVLSAQRCDGAIKTCLLF